MSLPDPHMSYHDWTQNEEENEPTQVVFLPLLIDHVSKLTGCTPRFVGDDEDHYDIFHF